MLYREMARALKEQLPKSVFVKGELLVLNQTDLFQPFPVSK
jgi:hypothetical protein